MKVPLTISSVFGRRALTELLVAWVLDHRWYRRVLQRASVEGHRWCHEHKELLGMVSIYNLNTAQLKIKPSSLLWENLSLPCVEMHSVSHLLQAFSPNHKNSIIRRQRQELKLLIAELKDRDRELNDMVAVHERHIQAWEDDRQKILTLAERCSLLSSKCCDVKNKILVF